MSFKSGDKVKIRDWDDMLVEYGADQDGDISFGQYKGWFMKNDRKYCGMNFTVKHSGTGVLLLKRRRCQILVWEQAVIAEKQEATTDECLLGFLEDYNK